MLRWFTQHRRSLPWRRTRDPYAVLVSEVMLQQTQVDRVVPKFEAFLRRFPTVGHLARARQSSVVKLWSGLGYNSRAVRLRQAALVIVKKYGATFPEMFDDLHSLPGIGAYTARALQTFAFNKHVAAVDVNHGRVVRRVFFGLDAARQSDVEETAASLVPEGRAYQWNQALMDFGALVCKSRPLCGICPVRRLCRAYPTVLSLPRAAKKREPFLGSDRYFRGKIIEQLRQMQYGTELPLRKLWHKVNTQHPVLLHRFTVLLTQLVKEGLVRARRVRRGHVVRLR